MESPIPGGGAFPPTAWTLLGQAAGSGEAARTALDEIGRLYWKPVYVYLRRKGRTEADAGDLTQSFFVHLIEGDLLAQPERTRGRFRTWLRAVLEHFLANAARIRAAQKRGGGRAPLSLDVEGAESSLRADSEITAEQAFDRTWARELLQRALGRLDREYTAAGRPQVLMVLRDRFGLGAAADEEVRVDDVTMHRARKRLKAIILDELGDAVRDADDAQAEVADLFQALGGKP